MKKRIPGILLSLALMIVMMPVFGMTAYAWDGEGTQDNPWKIGKSGSAVTAWLENKEGSETETILHIEGTGEMADFSSENPAPWAARNITSADIGENVTSIGSEAFNGCSDLVTVTFAPAAVNQQMKIGAYAFDQDSQILGYESGNTRLCCDDSVLQAGESLYSYNDKTLVWNISYDLWVKGTLVTETNKDNVLNDNPVSVSFTPEAGSSPATLTLKGATIEDGYIEGEKEYGIYYTGTDTLNIELAEGSDNQIVSNDFNSGIYSASTAATVIISGKGKLTATGSFAGIAAAKDVTVRDGKVTVAGLQGIHADHDITIEGGTLNASSSGADGYGMYAGRRATIIGGTVTTTATGDNSYGIHSYQGFVHFMGGEVTASGKEQAVSGRVILASGVTVMAGDNESSASDVTNSFRDHHEQKWAHTTSTTRYMLWVGGTLVTDDNKENVMGDGKVVFTPATNTDPATLTLKGANITTGYIYDQYDGYAAGIYYTGIAALKIVLEDNTDNKVKTESGAQDFEYAVWSRKADITVSGGGELTAYGKGSGIGVKTGNITIDGSTVTAGGSDNGIYIDAGVMEIKNNSIVNAIGTERSGICIETGDLDIKGGTVTAAGKDKAITGDVKNAIAGTGWDNTAGEGAGEQIAVSDTSRALAYKKAYFGTHTHIFTYSANSAVITATCTAANCPLAGSKITMTIVKPTRTTYEGTGAAAASLDGMADFNSVTGKSVKVGDIKYKGRDGTSYNESATPPTGAGKYTAKITVEEKTASVDYEIAKAEPKAGDFTFTAPSELTYNGNQKSATVVPKDGITGMGDVTVKYYSDAQCSTEVQNPTNVGTYYVGITVAEGTNYSETSSVLHDASWKFTITKATPSKEDFNFSAPSDLTYDGSAKNASVRAKQDITGMGEVTVKYYDSPACEDKLVNHINAGTYYVGITVAEGDNYNATSAVLHDASWKFTITKAAPKAGDFTYSAPSDLYYDGGAKSATVVKNEGITGMGDVTVKYYSDAQCSTEVQNPTNVGTYYVGITVTEDDNYSATTSVLHDASWEFTINKGNPIANAPSGLTASYGQKLSDVTLTNPTGNTPGSWSWADSSTSVGSVGEHTFKANFTPEDTANYNSKENVDVAVTVGKAANPATVNGTASVKKGGNELDLQGNVKLNGATGEVSYAISGETLGCTLSGSKLTSGNTEGSVTVNVAVDADDNYNASASMPITVKITKKDTQTITAEDVTVAYGDTGKKIEAITSGDGALSYEVKDGVDYIDVDQGTGVLTVKKPGSAIVTVKAAETRSYAEAAKDVNVTATKGEPTAAAVTANNRKYDGTKKPLVKADESILSGGTMQYALGSDDKTAPDKGWGESIPEAAEKGTYYVWYMVKGDANHNDSEPQSVTVTISEKGPEPVDESTITFDLNGGTLNGKTGKVTVTAANGTVITLPAPARDGYTFDYWEGSKYYAGDKYTVTEDHTLKAIWKTADNGGGSGSGSGSDSGKNGGKNGAKTGDDNALAAWIVLLLASLTGTAGMAFARKRRG